MTRSLLSFLSLLAWGGCAGMPATEAPVAGAAGEAERWTVLLVGNPAGELVVGRSPDGGRVYDFSFEDRGRGPELETRVALDDAGLPVAVATTGTDYFGNAVDERFVREDGVARWASERERGEAAVDGPVFFLGTQSAYPELALVARALAADPERGELRLLPAGSARLVGLEEHGVPGPGGGPRRLTHVQVGGIGFAPASVWLDEEGEHFATLSGWFALVPEGWEDRTEALVAIQDRARAEREERLAAELGRRSPDGFAFTGARLFDPRTGTTTPGRTVVVAGGEIVAVGADGEVPVPAGAEVVDAAGKTLLPGLWDMHVHLSPIDGILHLAAGVTSVRDLANDPEQLADLEERWRTGRAIGPRVVRAGIIDGPGPYAGPTRTRVATPEEAVAAVDRYADSGYEQVKLYSSLDPALVPPIVERAHERGLRVSGHVPQGLGASEAVELGFDELQHANFLFLEFLADETVDTRTPQRFTVVADRAAGLDLGSPEVAAFVERLAERGVVVDPTVTIFEQLFTARPGELPPAFAPVAERLPPEVRRSLTAGGLPVPEGADERYRGAFRAMLDLVGALHEAGVPIVAGTDSLAGFTLHRELELYVEAGIPAPEVLALATLGAARVADRADRLGTIEPGKAADLVLVDGDPSRDIADLRRIERVMKDGVLYDSARLYEAVGVRPSG